MIRLFNFNIHIEIQRKNNNNKTINCPGYTTANRWKELGNRKLFVTDSCRFHLLPAINIGLCVCVCGCGCVC